jgi:hypothetical protein
MTYRRALLKLTTIANSIILKSGIVLELTYVLYFYIKGCLCKKLNHSSLF